MRTLFDVINSTLFVGKVDICVDGDYRIAEMEKNSFISISSCTLDIGSDMSPFLSNGGDIVLTWISLTGPSLLPEMVLSPTRSCHLTVCGCTMDSVTVGASPIFGCSSYTASITSSKFSNVDHVILPSPLSHGPENTEPVDIHQFCMDFPAARHQMNLGSSSFWNVTDDLYGSITDAPISGKPFKLSHLHLRYSYTRRDLALSNSDHSVEYICQVTLPAIMEDCHFADIGYGKSSSFALNIYIASLVDVTVQSCTFTRCGSGSLDDMGVGAFRIFIPSVEDDDNIPHVLVKDCSVVECGGASLELNNLVFKDCLPCYQELYVMGGSENQNVDREVVIKNCLFENCTTEKAHGQIDTHMMGCCFVYHPGPVTVCDKTTFRNCKGLRFGSIFSCDSLTMKQVSFEGCESTKSSGAGVIWTNKLYMEDVLLSNCRAPTLPNGLLIQLSFNFKESIPRFEVRNSEKSYEVKNCYIEHDDSGDFDHLDILFSIDASDLKDGRLDPSKITNLHSNTDKFIVGVTTSGYSGEGNEEIPAFEDESATVAKEGPDPRTKEETEEPGDDPEGPKLPIWALVVIIVGSVVIVAAVVIIIVVVVVVNKKKEAKKVTDDSAPSGNEGMGHEMEAQDTSNE
ncbi:hypothetical protein BLNAU_24301 [Blattamonas nauphoetae]|uniref:Right handed beta helix domain-containing protein n=1 Tax=Blattamonas nauphoetae TaxID=2049346 RepID=A0ABQ9WMS9_9EUKA|nr:hypothetical protein BLNAU_24301 [Blattamonas nauphoetae]